MLEIIKRNGLPDTGAASSLASCPGKPFFLQRNYLRQYWSMAKLPEEKFELTAAFAEKIQNNLPLRQLSWHLYRYLTLNPMSNIEIGKLTDNIDVLGVDTGMLYLLTAMSLIPGFIARAHREGFPEKYGKAGAERIGSTTVFYAQEYNGAFGLRSKSLLFLLHYNQTATWRIGRFDFVVHKTTDTIPEIYCKDDEVIAFCADGIMLDENGEQVDIPEKSVRIAKIQTDGTRVTGIPIDFDHGLALNKQVTIDLKSGWEKVAGANDWTLFFHIPGGGGMTPKLCESSFKEALEFFKEYMPERNFRIIWSASWIFNPRWKEELPDSNLAKLITRGRLYPAVAGVNPGLYFVFGKTEGDPEQFTANNRLEKVVLQCYREKSLRRVGWFIRTSEITG
jgi:hypothetical protein